MKKPLPNYYSILKVAPNASHDAIKIGYRTLMVTMKMHPDLGGDHEVAAQINEAYEVLGDPVKRAAYDRRFLLQRLLAAQAAARAQGQAASRSTGAGARPGAAATAAPKYAPNPGQWGAEHGCPLCNAALPRLIGAETRCENCRSPLSPPPLLGAFGRELFGRRASTRIAKSHMATIYPAGQAQSINVKMRDLSLNGMSFYSAVALNDKQVFRFRDPSLEAVAAVVSCRKRGQAYAVHATLLTVAFQHNAGLFVSSSG
jgi:curved DNA-binding protein CbpA